MNIEVFAEIVCYPLMAVNHIHMPFITHGHTKKYLQLHTHAENKSDVHIYANGTITSFTG